MPVHKDGGCMPCSLGMHAPGERALGPRRLTPCVDVPAPWRAACGVLRSLQSVLCNARTKKCSSMWESG